MMHERFGMWCIQRYGLIKNSRGQRQYRIFGGEVCFWRDQKIIGGGRLQQPIWRGCSTRDDLHVRISTARKQKLSSLR